MKQINTEYTDTPASGANHNVSAVVPVADRTLVPRLPFDVLQSIDSADSRLIFVPSAPVSIGQPDRDEYYRAHPAPSLARTFFILRDRVCSDWYAVTPQVAAEIPDAAKPHTLYPLINRHGRIILWPVLMPTAKGWIDPWNRSAHLLIETLRSTWGRIKDSGKGYRIETAVSPFPEPRWPRNLNLRDLIEGAFTLINVDSVDHPIARRLTRPIA